MTKTMTANDRKLFVRIAKRCKKTDAYIYTHEDSINNFVRNHLRLFVTHPDVDPANPEMFMFQLSEQGRALFSKLMPPRIRAITILLIACLSANALFAQGLSQQHPDHPVNAPENLECVPGICVPRIELPRRDFMSTEQHQLTAPVRIAYIRRKAERKASNTVKAVQFLYLHDDCNCDESRLHYDMIEPAQELEQ